MPEFAIKLKWLYSFCEEFYTINSGIVEPERLHKCRIFHILKVDSLSNLSVYVFIKSILINNCVFVENLV